MVVSCTNWDKCFYHITSKYEQIKTYGGRLIFVTEVENVYLISKFKHEANHACLFVCCF